MKELGGKNTDQDDLREEEGRKIKETAERNADSCPERSRGVRGTYQYGLMQSGVDRCAMHGFFYYKECKTEN
jgi:hypothetical protein